MPERVHPEDLPDTPDPEHLVPANGIDARTGAYLMAPASSTQLATRLVPDMRAAAAGAGEPPLDTPEPTDALTAGRDEGDIAAMERVGQLEDGLMKVIAGVDDTDLSQAGWGIVFSGRDEHVALVAEIKEALAPLLERRARQAGDLFVCYDGADGVRGETGDRWMARHGVGTGSADPRQMPFYLLIAGPPEHISFEFQYRMDVQRAVGRLHFDDVTDYRRYADAVVVAETTPPDVAGRLELFGPRNRGDAATSLSMSRLIEPLAKDLGRVVNWETNTTTDVAATREALARLVNGDASALLVTAGHGVGYDADDAEQRARQGALICADWPGVGKPVAPEHAFAAADVVDDAALTGRMALLFACYGGGTPARDDFAHRVDPAAPEQIAPTPFVAALPQRLLAGGMLAVMAHVDRAWSHSFMSPGASAHQTFASTLRQLMNGKPVGVAFDDFNVRTGELAIDLTTLLTRVAAREIESYVPYATTWTAATDARNLMVLGDPATRLTI